jgi:hypothetical protein
VPLTDGALVFQPPGRVPASVNGIPVIGFQVLRSGDVVQLEDDPGGNPRSFRVGRVLAQVRSGEGRRCRYTGLPITGDAIECSCGMIYARAVAQHIHLCLNPRCSQSLEDVEAPFPPEELL